MGLLSLAIFWKLNGNSFREMMGLAGCLFFLLINSVMSNVMPTILTFSEERPVFLREQANNMYGVLPYYLAKTLVEFPI